MEALINKLPSPNGYLPVILFFIVHKETIEIIRPFGPSILKATLPNDMINDLNQECLDISNNKKEDCKYNADIQIVC